MEKEQLIHFIYECINNRNYITISIESGTAASSAEVVPISIDEGNSEIIVYSINHLFVIPTTNLTIVNDEFISNNGNAIMTIAA